MGKAISASLRLEIINARQKEKLSYRSLAERFKVNYNTVRRLILLHQQKGKLALSPNYSNCGRPINSNAEKAYRLVRLIRYFHPQWGVPYILMRIEIAFPNLDLQSIRHYQRRLKKDFYRHKVAAATIPREPVFNDVRLPHDEWQIDAKEQIKLASGTRTCYLNVTDKKTNALLKAKTFPPRMD